MLTSTHHKRIRNTSARNTSTCDMSVSNRDTSNRHTITRYIRAPMKHKKVKAPYPHLELNPGPSAPQSTALPSELSSQACFKQYRIDPIPYCGRISCSLIRFCSPAQPNCVKKDIVADLLLNETRSLTTSTTDSSQRRILKVSSENTNLWK